MLSKRTSARGSRDRSVLCAFGLVVVCAALCACSGEGIKPILPDDVDIQWALPDSSSGRDGADTASTDALLDFNKPETPDGAIADGDAGPLGSCPPGQTGSFLCPCVENADCDSGFCVPSAAGMVCTRSCLTDCPAGWICNPVGTEPDVIYLCIDRSLVLCRPCHDSGDCQEERVALAGYCRAQGPDGAFCGTVCLNDADCPSGNVCVESTTTEDGVVALCQPSAGECACSELSIQNAAETDCYRANDFGRCDATRVCTAAGLSACSAPVPESERCDHLDNDCDGATDEDVADPEAIGDPCTDDDDGDGVLDVDDCAPFDPEVGVCDDGNPCTDDLCNAEFGICAFPPRSGDCDDGNPCTIGERCDAGVCVPREILDPDDGNECTEDGCDAERGIWHSPLSDVGCDDGNPCTVEERCYSGLCAGGSPKGCDDGEPCTDDSCLPELPEGCLHTPNTAPCEDDNPCTENDRCAAGVCLPGAPRSCDDLDPCTDDRCDPLTGLCQSSPTIDPAILEQAEFCNGIDDNCDGLVDTDDPDMVLEPCERQQGVCEGVEKEFDLCQAGAWLACDDGYYAERVPDFETVAEATCDELDNDCDGATDDDFAVALLDGTIVNGAGQPCGTGLCSGGVTVCGNDTDTIACTTEDQATTELCNGFDDDCDGLIDDGFATISCGVGQCLHSVSACQGGGDPQCDPFEGASPETCDNVDNDCDDQTDEGDPGGGTPCLVAGLQGNCSEGATQCQTGSLQCVQTVLPAAESCNLQDDDCDGQTDNGNPGGGAGCSVAGLHGICAEGTTQCQAGALQCVQTVFAGTESCNGLDDDCDGLVDDNAPGGGAPCTVDGLLGICAAGVTQCQGGSLRCVQTVFPGSETCNLQDDDCDGQVDDNTAGSGNACTVAGLQGNCAQGNMQCQSGTLRCTQTVYPTAESCNGQDDDCDGQIDDGNPGGGASCTVSGQQGICANGTTQCQSGSLRCVQTVFPGSETCNLQDDDCDGQVDDGSSICSGGRVCRNGTCCLDADGDGYYADCAPYDCSGHDNDRYIYPGATEYWDVRDNDCDGLHDEDGLFQYNRFFKAWAANDYEHRYSRNSSMPGFESDSRWIKLYPPTVCQGSLTPPDRCMPDPINGDREMQLWGGFELEAVSMCTGIVSGGWHLTLLLSEMGGEYDDYLALGFDCTRLGYFPAGSAGENMPSAVRLYRHRSAFGGTGVADNMWSSCPREGHPTYNVHDTSFKVVGCSNDTALQCPSPVGLGTSTVRRGSFSMMFRSLIDPQRAKAPRATFVRLLKSGSRD